MIVSQQRLSGRRACENWRCHWYGAARSIDLHTVMPILWRSGSILTYAYIWAKCACSCTYMICQFLEGYLSVKIIKLDFYARNLKHLKDNKDMGFFFFLIQWYNKIDKKLINNVIVLITYFKFQSPMITRWSIMCFRVFIHLQRSRENEMKLMFR